MDPYWSVLTLAAGGILLAVAAVGVTRQLARLPELAARVAELEARWPVVEATSREAHDVASKARRIASQRRRKRSDDDDEERLPNGATAAVDPRDPAAAEIDRILRGQGQQ